MITIVAEAGVGHDGDLAVALKMVDAAKAAGANIVKFQNYIPTEAIHPLHKDYRLLERLALSHASFRTIAKHCEDVGIEFMSTPGDLESLKFLVDLGVKRIKIGSDDLTYIPLLVEAGRTGLPIILSTGMATIQEIETAFCAVDIPFTPPTDLTLLHCVSSYPCAPKDANLLAIMSMQITFGLQIGYSDHCQGYVACLAAAAMGAVMIEKHFEFRYGALSVDHDVCINEAQLADMVRDIRIIEQMLGSGIKVPCEAEKVNIPLVRKRADGRKLA